MLQKNKQYYRDVGAAAPVPLYGWVGGNARNQKIEIAITQRI
jgi:hypothetical protein